jgi:hypothetical protein
MNGEHNIKPVSKHQVPQPQPQPTSHLQDREEYMTTLTPHEVAELRAILVARERIRWLHSTVRLWVGYVSGGLVSLYIIWDYVEKLIQKLLS